MLGRVVKREPLGQPPCLVRGKRFVERGRSMRVQVVQHDRDASRCRVQTVGQVAHGAGPIGAGAALGDLDLAPARERFTEQEQVGYPLSFLFVVLAPRLTRRHRQRNPRFAAKWLTGLIPADYGGGRIERALVDGQHVFPRGHKGGIVCGRNRPVLFPMRLQLVFFSVRRIVSCEIEPTCSSSTI
jgi:hypothetical protein